MKKIKLISFVLLAAMAITGFGTSCKNGTQSGKVAGSGPFDLKINFKPGEKFLYSTQVDQKIESITSMNQAMMMEMVYAYEGNEGSDKKLSITYDHIKMDVTSPMVNYSYDSKAPAKDNSMGDLGQFIGKTFTISVSPDGQIKKVEGLKEIMNGMGAAGGAKGEANAANAFNDSSVIQMMRTSFELYPGKPVNIGDTWVKKSAMGFNGISVEVENTYTLKAVEGNKAVISLSSVMRLPKSDMGPAGSGMQLEMTGTQDGTLDVDVATGVIISGKTKQDIKGTMTVPGMPQALPMNIKGDITVTSKKL